MKIAPVLPVFICLWAGSMAFMDFSERMIPTFLLPLFDQNDDGVLSNGEIEEVKSHLPSFGFNSGESRLLMATADRNKDGVLNSSEFKDLYQLIMAEQVRRLEEAINK
ncbi:uncharacterized protein [Haliotis asinina]|uniref:uncharacterized protein n=1 Tax=Haliotis asinina TaxID=109174 RepID=UPI00353215DC